MGDYLYKNGNIYKIVPHWDDEFVYGFDSIFLQESTGKMYCGSYPIATNDFSYIPATEEQITKFDAAEKLYQ